MPNRMLRDWTSSMKMKTLSAFGERFFVRLIMKADDFGNFSAELKEVNGALFPKLRDITETNCADWLNECLHAGLIHLYEVDQEYFIHINNFGQRLDRTCAKFPRETEGRHVDNLPQPNANHPPHHANLSRPELEVEVEVEIEDEVEVLVDKSRPIKPDILPTFDDFWEAYDKKVDRIKCLSLWQKLNQATHELIMLYLTDYIPATIEKKFRLNPATFLKNQSWQNEIIKQQNGTKKIDPGTQHALGLVESLKRLDG